MPTPAAGQDINAGDIGAPAVTWVPVLTSTGTAVALGSGGGFTQTGVWWRIGQMVYATGRFGFGSTGAAAGTGDYRLTLPVSASASLVASGSLSAGLPIGWVTLRDASAVAASTSAIVQLSSASQGLMMSNTGGGIGGVNPWTWAAGDQINFTVCYPID